MSEVHLCRDCEHRVGSDPYYMCCNAYKTERFQSVVSGRWCGGRDKACWDVRVGDTCKHYEKRKTFFEWIAGVFSKNKNV